MTKAWTFTLRRSHCSAGVRTALRTLSVPLLLVLVTGYTRDAHGEFFLPQPLDEAIILPPDGAEGVPTNARILVDRYYGLYGSLHPASNENQIYVLENNDNGVLSFPQLQASTGYQASISSGTHDTSVVFRTDVAADERPPEILDELEIVDVCSFETDCDGATAAILPNAAPFETYAITLRLPRVVDETFVVWLPEIADFEGGGPVGPVSFDGGLHWVVGSPTSTREVILRTRIADEASARTFRLVAMDLAGNLATSTTTQEVLLEPAPSCATAHAGRLSSPSTSPLGLVGVGGIALVFCRRARSLRRPGDPL